MKWISINKKENSWAHTCNTKVNIILTFTCTPVINYSIVQYNNASKSCQVRFQNPLWKIRQKYAFKYSRPLPIRSSGIADSPIHGLLCGTYTVYSLFVENSPLRYFSLRNIHKLLDFHNFVNKCMFCDKAIKILSISNFRVLFV